MLYPWGCTPGFWDPWRLHKLGYELRGTTKGPLGDRPCRLVDAQAHVNHSGVHPNPVEQEDMLLHWTPSSGKSYFPC